MKCFDAVGSFWGFFGSLTAHGRELVESRSHFEFVQFITVFQLHTFINKGLIKQQKRSSQGGFLLLLANCSLKLSNLMEMHDVFSSIWSVNIGL